MKRFFIVVPLKSESIIQFVNRFWFQLQRIYLLKNIGEDDEKVHLDAIFICLYGKLERRRSRSRFSDAEGRFGKTVLHKPLDINADGADDIVIGDWGYETSSANTGAVYFWY